MIFEGTNDRNVVVSLPFFIIISIIGGQKVSPTYRTTRNHSHHGVFQIITNCLFDSQNIALFRVPDKGFRSAQFGNQSRFVFLLAVQVAPPAVQKDGWTDFRVGFLWEIKEFGTAFGTFETRCMEGIILSSRRFGLSRKDSFLTDEAIIITGAGGGWW